MLVWQGEYSLVVCLRFTDLRLQKTACIRACLGCQQTWAKCQVGVPRSVPQKRTREEESPEEGSSRRTQVRCPWDMRSEGGADIGPLLEGVRSALEEQTWLMWQMWATHTAIESELRLLQHSVEYAFDCLFWVPCDEWRGERGSGQGEAQGEGQHRAPEEAREGEVTIE